MKIGIAQKQGYTQIDLAGAFKAEGVSVMREEMDHLLAMRPTRVLWNMGALSLMSPEAFCEVARAMARVRIDGGTSVLVNASEEVRSYIAQISFDTFVSLSTDASAAVRLVAPPSGPRRSEFIQSSLLGEILIDLGVLDEPGLKRALDEQRGRQGQEKLGSILLRLNIVTPAQILDALETQYRRRVERSGAKSATPPNRAEFIRKNLLGEILKEIGVIDDSGLRRALEEQRRLGTKEKLGDVLLRLKIVTPEQLLRALETQAKV